MKVRKIGLGDITYCNSDCTQEKCKRNLRFWKAPTEFYSVSNFDEKCEDTIHSKCVYKWLNEDLSSRK